MDSILTSVKKFVGVGESYTHFDPDIIMHINSVFFTLYQLGIGDKPFVITGDGEEWSDFSPMAEENLEAIKSYMYLQVRLLFDPPTNAALLNAMKEMVKEYEWRLNVEVDPE